MLEPPNPAAITCWRTASASALVAVAPTRTRQPRSPEKSASDGVVTFSTRGSRPAARSADAVARASTSSLIAAGGASGSGELGPAGIATSTVHTAFGSVWPRTIRVSVTPACRVRVVLDSSSPGGPSGRAPATVAEGRSGGGAATAGGATSARPVMAEKGGGTARRRVIDIVLCHKDPCPQGRTSLPGGRCFGVRRVGDSPVYISTHPK